MTMAAIDVTTTAPLSHEQAVSMQATGLERTLTLLRSLDRADWSAQTDCPDWDVRHMYLHVLGACDAAASIRENLHQMRTAKRHQKSVGGPLEAALSAVQVRERLDVTPGELVERLAAVAPVTVRRRTKLPAIVRRMRLKVDGPVVEKWTLGYLVGTIYLRDLWMHRVDAARATGRDLVLSPDHDGLLIGDVVAEWGRRHRRPFELELTGVAGGVYTSTGSGTTIDSPTTLSLDAVEFCRVLAGRAKGTGLLDTIVPF